MASVKDRRTRQINGQKYEIAVFKNPNKHVERKLSSDSSDYEYPIDAVSPPSPIYSVPDKTKTLPKKQPANSTTPITNPSSDNKSQTLPARNLVNLTAEYTTPKSASNSPKLPTRVAKSPLLRKKQITAGDLEGELSRMYGQQNSCRVRHHSQFCACQGKEEHTHGQH